MAMNLQKIIRLPRLNRHNLLKIQAIFHYSCYYTAWVLGIALVAKGNGWLATGLVLAITALQVIWQYYIDKRTEGLWTMIFIFTLAGFIVDSSFLRAGLVFSYDNPWMPYWSPPWLISLWGSFAVAFYTLMRPLWKRYFMLGVSSLFAVPFFYYVGLKLGVGLLPQGDLSVVAYGVVWALLMPGCAYICQK